MDFQFRPTKTARKLQGKHPLGHFCLCCKGIWSEKNSSPPESSKDPNGFHNAQVVSAGGPTHGGPLNIPWWMTWDERYIYLHYIGEKWPDEQWEMEM